MAKLEEVKEASELAMATPVAVQAELDLLSFEVQDRMKEEVKEVQQEELIAHD